ncbi:unnamed protein product, partial [Urochloa humidicola]
THSDSPARGDRQERGARRICISLGTVVAPSPTPATSLPVGRQRAGSSPPAPPLPASDSSTSASPSPSSVRDLPPSPAGSWLRFPKAMEKYNSNTQFVPLRDERFALRGTLDSSSSNLEQTRGYTSSPLAALRPNMSRIGSRPLHTSRPLSSPVANRPLSPHLPLKKPQFSATFSISHRIFGVALGVAIISVPLATKFSLMFGV